MTTQAAKSEGKIAQLHALWAKYAEGELLPRTFAVDLAVAEGFNPATARTQYQVWFARWQAEQGVLA